MIDEKGWKQDESTQEKMFHKFYNRKPRMGSKWLLTTW